MSSVWNHSASFSPNVRRALPQQTSAIRFGAGTSDTFSTSETANTQPASLLERIGRFINTFIEAIMDGIKAVFNSIASIFSHRPSSPSPIHQDLKTETPVVQTGSLNLHPHPINIKQTAQDVRSMIDTNNAEGIRDLLQNITNLGDLRSVLQSPDQYHNPLLHTVFRGTANNPRPHPDISRVLLEALARIPVADRLPLINRDTLSGHSLFTGAVCNRDVEQVKQLLALGADINLPDSDHSMTPLHWAALRGKEEVITCLLQNGAQASINQPDNTQNTPLHWAVQRKKHPQITQLLLENGAAASLGQGNDSGRTPLHLAVREQTLPVASLLLAHGAARFIEQADLRGETPLQMAARYLIAPELAEGSHQRYFQMAALLLACGADPASVPPQLPEQVHNQFNGQRDQQADNLVNSPDPAVVRQAMRWFQQFSIAQLVAPGSQLSPDQRQGVLDWFQPASARCNQFLLERNQQLNNPDLSKLDKIAILGRCRPILKSGIPCDPAQLDAIAGQATEIKHFDVMNDSLNAGTPFTSMGFALAQLPKTQPVAPAAAS